MSLDLPMFLQSSFSDGIFTEAWKISIVLEQNLNSIFASFKYEKT